MKIIPALFAVAFACVSAAAQHEGHEGHEKGAQSLHETMTKSSQEMQSMEMSGNLDRDFVQGMLMHHRHGVEMAKIQVQQGSDPKAKEFAKKVIDTQTKEIKQLESWLKTHKGESKTP